MGQTEGEAGQESESRDEARHTQQHHAAQGQPRESSWPPMLSSTALRSSLGSMPFHCVRSVPLPVAGGMFADLLRVHVFPLLLPLLPPVFLMPALRLCQDRGDERKKGARRVGNGAADPTQGHPGCSVCSAPISQTYRIATLCGGCATSTLCRPVQP